MSTRRARNHIVVVAVVSVVAAALGACGSSDEDAGGSGAGQQRPTLTIENFRYSPNPLLVPVGARVLVANKDEAAHTATAEDKSFDTGNLAPGAEEEITLSQAGELAYICSIHNYMRGVIRVSG
ncbi:MAG: cupredoxin domain-containing protein [Actinomycetota bacterium]|nr:cupredoxin domain-containing protein [Actinomycetota bacterium]